MLVMLKQILNLCEARQCAAGSFNTPNLESVMAVIQAAEELDVPVILQHAQVHEELMPLEVIAPIMLGFARKAKVPVCVHLDHGETLDYVCRALELGFTSVMYDGSVLSYEENVSNTRMAVSFARQTGASVEAEIGSMGKRETGEGSAGAGEDSEKIYTDPGQAKLFVDATGVDALACSFGTTHGLYLSEPKLDFSVVEKVRALADIPVVMHGGSGVSEKDFQKAIRAGVRKINYYTYMAMAGGESIRSNLQEGGKDSGENPNFAKAPVMYHDIVSWGTLAMKENCKKAMQIFAMR
ncbi:MAG: class II fructose-bisphosphate aldolase [Coprococcus sp.]|nr:class II fructose-bisphosphate aldolase [Coprococcus sp.]